MARKVDAAQRPVARAMDAVRKGLTVTQAAHKHGVTPSALHKACKAAGIPTRRISATDEARRQKVIRAVQNGMMMKDAAEKFGGTVTSISRICRAAGLDFNHRKGQRRVSQAKWDKVDWNQPNVVIARKLGISRERVRQVRSRMAVYSTI